MLDSLLYDYRFPDMADHIGSSVPRRSYSGLSWFGEWKGRPLVYQLCETRDRESAGRSSRCLNP